MLWAEINYNGKQFFPCRNITHRRINQHQVINRVTFVWSVMGILFFIRSKPHVMQMRSKNSHVKHSLAEKRWIGRMVITFLLIFTFFGVTYGAGLELMMLIYVRKFVESSIEKNLSFIIAWWATHPLVFNALNPESGDVHSHHMQLKFHWRGRIRF